MFVFGTAEDVFTMAVRIEENGKTFYQGAAQQTDSEGLEKLFEELSLMEDGHITLFKGFLGELVGSLPKTWDPEGLAESYLQATADSHIFTKQSASERLKGITTVDDAFDMALQFEKDSVAFFLGMKNLLPDEKTKGEIDKLIEQEQQHVTMLSRAKKEWQDKGVLSVPGAEGILDRPDRRGRPEGF
jgi:rubrerythrin